ncbi:MAG: bifunctional oligoribonuclease/PAP phosphatase NrnA [Anaerolineae bacterium]
MYNLLYEQYPLPKLHLKGHILQTITLRAGGQIACVGLSQKTLQAFNVTLSDLDGFSGLAGQIKGVKLSIFLVELPGKRVKVSLRSNGQIAVNGLAAHFGGGGHVPAAGAVINAGLAEATEVLVAEAAKLLPENQAAGAVSIK